MSNPAPTTCPVCNHDTADDHRKGMDIFKKPPLERLAEKWFERFKGAHFVNVRVRKGGDWTEYEGDDIATAIKDAARSASPEPKALDLADERSPLPTDSQEFIDGFNAGFRRAKKIAERLRTKATTEPTREQTVTDAMVEDAIEAYNDCASYNTQAVNMRAALEAALFRAEAKPDALGRYHRIGPDGFCEDCG